MSPIPNNSYIPAQLTPSRTRMYSYRQAYWCRDCATYAFVRWRVEIVRRYPHPANFEISSSICWPQPVEIIPAPISCLNCGWRATPTVYLTPFCTLCGKENPHTCDEGTTHAHC